jgi:thiol-disulfide isomerase/thioredoxin
VLVGSRGSVWELSRSALLSGRSRERREFRSFALESFDGGTLSSEDLHGKVALVAFWASWCGPCREELPLLDSLHRAVDRPDFAVIGINEDVNEEDGRAFAEQLGPELEMTMLLGRGRMRRRYHYSGLPYSVLLDREGRIVREYYGFGGREAFDVEVAGRVLAELGSLETGSSADHRAGDTSAHDHRREESSGPAMAHDHSHGPTREVTGGEMDALAAYLSEAQRLQPSKASDVPESHYEIVLDGLAQVDGATNGFMEEFPGTFELIQLMTLKTQLYVDVDRLPNLSDPQQFTERWAEHLSSLEYLLEAYQQLHRQETAAPSSK